MDRPPTTQKLCQQGSGPCRANASIAGGPAEPTRQSREVLLSQRVYRGRSCRANASIAGGPAELTRQSREVLLLSYSENSYR